jgi:hypothetical protein
MVPLQKVITGIVTGIERRADLIVVSKPLTLTAKAPGLFRPIVERLDSAASPSPAPSAGPRRPDGTTPPHTTDITRARPDSPGGLCRWQLRWPSGETPQLV